MQYNEIVFPYARECVHLCIRNECSTDRNIIVVLNYRTCNTHKREPMRINTKWNRKYLHIACSLHMHTQSRPETSWEKKKCCPYFHENEIILIILLNGLKRRPANQPAPNVYVKIYMTIYKYARMYHISDIYNQIICLWFINHILFQLFIYRCFVATIALNSCRNCKHRARIKMYFFLLIFFFLNIVLYLLTASLLRDTSAKHAMDHVECIDAKLLDVFTKMLTRGVGHWYLNS